MGQYWATGQARQSVESEAPSVARYVPASQEVGVTVATPQNCPAGQMKQSEDWVAPRMFLYVPPGHSAGTVEAWRQ